ncbi:MAG: magnesium citrate secondary transporter [Cyclobacteriaceae bacterium]
MSVFKNPFFILPGILFWCNQYLERINGLFIPFIHSYWDDLLAIPVILGITLQVFRWIQPGKAGFIFTKMQILVGVAYFGFIFEGLLPLFSATYTSDPWDLLCYFLGTFWFYFFINKEQKVANFEK